MMIDSTNIVLLFVEPVEWLLGTIRAIAGDGEELVIWFVGTASACHL